MALAAAGIAGCAVGHLVLAGRCTDAHGGLQFRRQVSGDTVDFDPGSAAALASFRVIGHFGTFSFLVAALLPRVFSTKEAAAETVKRRQRQAVWLCCFLLFAASGAFFFRAVEPDNFPSMPKAIYFVVVTLTTIGYGDVAPVSGGGRVFLVIYALVGLPFMAFIASVYGNLFLDGFTSIVSAPEKLWRRRKLPAALSRCVATDANLRHRTYDQSACVCPLTEWSCSVPCTNHAGRQGWRPCHRMQMRRAVPA